VASSIDPARLVRRVRSLTGVRPVQTARLRRRGGGEGCRVHRGSTLVADPSASLDVLGRLWLGNQWARAPYQEGFLTLGERSRLEVSGRFRIYSGFRSSLDDGAVLALGSGYANNGLTLACFERIDICDDVALSENVTGRDSDNEHITGQATDTAPFRIGDHVLIGIGPRSSRASRSGTAPWSPPARSSPATSLPPAWWPVSPPR
jgi:hypothetical protein